MNNELMHYGVPGMKWGVRRAQYDAMSRSEKKAHKKQFKKDVRLARKKGLLADYKYDPDTNTTQATQWYNSNNKKVGKEYAEAVLNTARNKDIANRVAATLVGSAIYAAGHAAVQYLVTKRINQMGMG